MHVDPSPRDRGLPDSVVDLLVAVVLPDKLPALGTMHPHSATSLVRTLQSYILLVLVVVVAPIVACDVDFMTYGDARERSAG